MNKSKNKLPPFVASFIATMDSPAWRALPHGARSLFLALKRRYSRKLQTAVYLSVRVAAKELGSNKNLIPGWYRALVHGGFLVEVQPGRLGVEGKGKSALYRLTDEPYQGEPPTRDFLRWEKQNPVPKNGDRVSPKMGTVDKGQVSKNPNNGGSPPETGVPKIRDISRYSSHLSEGAAEDDGPPEPA
jgi:hypothetical protein